MLKLLAKFFEKLFNITNVDGVPRADMYLPEKLLAFAIVFFLVSVGVFVYALTTFSLLALIVAILVLVLSVCAVLCWKNQTIEIISDEEFVYTTMFGNAYTYKFSDITGLRQNQDSMTLFVSDRKIHIESMAILSDRLIDLVNNALEA